MAVKNGERSQKRPQTRKVGDLRTPVKKTGHGLILDKSITVTVTHRKFGKEPEWSE